MFWLVSNNMNNLTDMIFGTNVWVNLLIHTLRFVRLYVRSFVYFPVGSFVRAGQEYGRARECGRASVWACGRLFAF